MDNILTEGSIFTHDGNLYMYCPYYSIRPAGFKCKEVTDDKTKPLFIYKGKQYGIDASKLVKFKESERDNIKDSIIGQIGADEMERIQYMNWFTNMGFIAHDMAQRRFAKVIIPANLIVLGISTVKGIPEVAYNAALAATGCGFAGGMLSLINLKYRTLDKIMTSEVRQKPFLRSACRTFKKNTEEKIACPQITICDITPPDERGPECIRLVPQDVNPMKKPEREKTKEKPHRLER